MRRIVATPFIRAGEYERHVHSASSGENGEIFLTPKEAAEYLRVSKSYLDKMRVYGGGPTFLRFGKRKILYRKSDLDLWASERCFCSTSEYRRQQDQ